MLDFSKKNYRTMFLNDTIGIVEIMVRHRVTLSHEKLLGKFYIVMIEKLQF